MTPKAYYTIILMKMDTKSKRGIKGGPTPWHLLGARPLPYHQMETEFDHQVQKQPTLGDIKS